MKKEAEWCIKKAQEAANDYDIEAVKNYLGMARMWLARGTK